MSQPPPETPAEALAQARLHARRAAAELAVALRSLVDAAALASEGAAARVESDASARLELLRRAEAMLVGRGFPVIPIYFYVVSGLVKPHVEGFYTELELPDGTRAPNLQDLHPLREVRVGRR